AVIVWVYVVQNVETPRYTLLDKDGAIELRDYPPLVVAQVIREGARERAVNRGFSPLAGYIFARERSGPSIAMTAPVTQQRVTQQRVTPAAPSGQVQAPAVAPTPAQPAPQTPPVPAASSPPGSAASAWQIRFIMPSRYTKADLPTPADGSGVTLHSLPAQRRAAIRFSGVATDAAIAKQEAALRAWLEARKLQVAGPAIYAYYNDPFTPGFLRRNEVIITIAPGP
ncbi:MAG: heme-binding protein, partial [Pseudomonadota bacterium]